MLQVNFNNNWQWRKLGEGEWKQTDLPHDAMQYEERKAGMPSGVNGGWFDCYDYEYKKTFTIPKEYEGKKLILEFEGVYRNAEVYLNGEKVAYRPYGYTNFYVECGTHVRVDGENEIRVVAKNADQPNSRWYSGTGIYRPVYLWVAEKKHILQNGIKIKTLQIHPAIIEVKVQTNCEGEVSITLEGEPHTAQTENGNATFTLPVENAKLWTPESPTMYALTAKFYDDIRTEKFGIRTLEVTAEKGFCLNGERVIIKGACMHHDNGILGARCYKEAEYRKVAILKENGYNAIRSAHNPCSKDLLNACDELGMLMMDEYVDMWYIHKTMYDYADYVADWYEQDIADMIDKDYNHPCVVMYSFGNEVAETGQKKGIEFFKKMRDLCHELDGTRPTTVGVNIFFNWLHSMGFGVYSDEKAKANPDAKVGSEFFNVLAGITGDTFMKFMATLYPCDVKTRDCYAAMDVAGYNYGIMRYKHDVKKYPNRIILGSETFCSDAYEFYELAKQYPSIIGDFVWSGFDYLGELALGAWEYKEYASDFNKGLGWISAGQGRIDLVGNPYAETLYTQVAFELEDRPMIGVVPVNHTNEPHSPSAWRCSNAIPTWSWNGLNGQPAKVEVYSRAPYVELYVNGKKVGKKKRGNDCMVKFKTTYQDGEITAVNVDKQGNELSRYSLYTGGDETILSVLPEKTQVALGEVCFVPLAYTDAKGNWKPLEHHRISVEVKGGELLALGHGGPFNTESYMNTDTDTYYGRAMAVVKATSDQVVITAKGNGLVGKAEISAK